MWLLINNTRNTCSFSASCLCLKSEHTNQFYIFLCILFWYYYSYQMVSKKESNSTINHFLFKKPPHWPRLWRTKPICAGDAGGRSCDLWTAEGVAGSICHKWHSSQEEAITLVSTKTLFVLQRRLFQVQISDAPLPFGSAVKKVTEVDTNEKRAIDTQTGKAYCWLIPSLSPPMCFVREPELHLSLQLEAKIANTRRGCFAELKMKQFNYLGPVWWQA